MSQTPAPDDRPGSALPGPGSWIAPGSEGSAYEAPPSAPPAGWSPMAPPDAPAPQPGTGGLSWGSGIDNPPPLPQTNPLTAHQPGIVPLRPLGVGDMVQATFAALRRAAGTYYLLTVIVWLGALLLSAVVVYGVILPISAGEFAFDDTTVQASGTVVLIAASVAAAPLTGFASYVVNQQAVGRTPSLDETARWLRPELGRLLGLSALLLLGSGLLVGAPTAALTYAGDNPALVGVALGVLIIGSVAAVWLSIRLSCCLPALVVEHLGIAAAIRRSFDLTRGMFWRTLGVVALISLATSMITVVVGGLTDIVVSVLYVAGTSGISTVAATVTFLAALIANVAVAPILPIGLSILHIDARVRTEAYDLALAEGATEVQSGRWFDGWPTGGRR